MTAFSQTTSLRSAAARARTRRAGGRAASTAWSPRLKLSVIVLCGLAPWMLIALGALALA